MSSINIKIPPLFTENDDYGIWKCDIEMWSEFIESNDSLGLAAQILVHRVSFQQKYSDKDSSSSDCMQMCQFKRMINTDNDSSISAWHLTVCKCSSLGGNQGQFWTGSFWH